MKISSKRISKKNQTSKDNDTAFNFCQQHPADIPGSGNWVFAGKVAAPQPAHLITGDFLRFQPMFVI